MAQESIVIKNYFSIHFKILLACGIPIEKLTFKFEKLYIVYAFIMNAFVSTLYAVLEIVYIFTRLDADSFSFVISYFISHFLAVCKIFLLFAFRNEISKFCKIVETGRFLPDPQRGGNIENTYIQNAINTSNKRSFFFHIFVMIIVFPRYISSALSKGEDVEIYDDETKSNVTVHIPTKPFITYIPFDSNYTPLHQIVSLYQTFSCAFYGFLIAAADAIIYGIMCHIKAQFLILIHSLETFLDRTEKLIHQNGIEINLQRFKSPKRLQNGMYVVEKLPKEAQKYAKICITDCIQHHQEILLLAEGCESTFCWLLLIQFGGSSLLICMQLYQLSLYNIVSLPFLTMLCYLGFGSLQLLVFCWHGNEVKLISEKVCYTAFACNWQLLDTSTQKLILLMIHRAGKPITLTAGKFIFLSLESFMSSIKGSASYFMFLKEMNKEEKIRKKDALVN